MKKILLLGTGGTIASEMSPDGLTPELGPQQPSELTPQQGETGGHFGGHLGVGHLGTHLGGGWHCCWFCWQDILVGRFRS